MRTQGRAFDRSDAPLPFGTPVRTFIDGVEYSNASSVYDSLGDFSVLTRGNWMTSQSVPETPAIKEGANLNETVVYAAGNFTSSADVFQEALPWWTGRVTTQDLHLGSAATTPAAIKIQGIVARPARGGNQFLFLCNPTANSVSLSSYYLEVDRPGTYHGPNVTLVDTLPPNGDLQVSLPSTSFLTPTGDALKLVYRNPRGLNASAGGLDIVVDRIEFNATQGGTLSWEPGNTIMGDAPAPGIGQILERTSACADTNSPADFQITTEPGLPANEPPTVVVTSPSAGQTVTGGQPVGVSWNMVDDIFPTSTLLVWVNVSYPGVSSTLVNGSPGTTNASWLAPDADLRGVLITVDVIDPFGARGTASTTFNVARPQPFAGLAVLVAVLVIVVIAVFLLWAFFHAMREKEPPRERIEVRPPAPRQPAPQAAPPAEAATSGPVVEGQKLCPKCGTAVNAINEWCFFCGYRFPGPPT